MPNSITESVIELISDQTGLHKSKIKMSDRIEADLHVTGDDVFELMTELSMLHRIDMTSFKFGMYFCYEGEIPIFSYLFFHRRRLHRKEFPVTVQHLIDVVNRGCWFQPNAAKDQERLLLMFWCEIVFRLKI